MSDSLRFTALPWATWAAVMAVVVLATNNVLVLATAVLGCWMAIAVLGGPRRQVARAAVGASLGLAALWVLLGVLVRREGLGGRVVWILPDWSVASGGAFAGAVTTGQLHLAAVRGLQALTLVAVIGLLAQAVSATDWGRLAVAAAGRASVVGSVLVGLPQAYVDQRREATATARSGLGRAGPSEVLTDLVDRATVVGEAATGHVEMPRSGARPTAGMLTVLAVALWWGSGAITPERPGLVTALLLPDVSGLERTIIAAAVLVVVGVGVFRRPLPRPTAGDALPVLSALLVAGAWYGRGLVGEREDVVVQLGVWPTVPVVLLVALAALPVLAIAGRGKR